MLQSKKFGIFQFKRATRVKEKIGAIHLFGAVDVQYMNCNKSTWVPEKWCTFTEVCLKYRPFCSCTSWLGRPLSFGWDLYFTSLSTMKWHKLVHFFRVAQRATHKLSLFYDVSVVAHYFETELNSKKFKDSEGRYSSPEAYRQTIVWNIIQTSGAPRFVWVVNFSLLVKDWGNH